MMQIESRLMQLATGTTVAAGEPGGKSARADCGGISSSTDLYLQSPQRQEDVWKDTDSGLSFCALMVDVTAPTNAVRCDRGPVEPAKGEITTVAIIARRSQDADAGVFGSRPGEISFAAGFGDLAQVPAAEPGQDPPSVSMRTESGQTEMGSDMAAEATGGKQTWLEMGRAVNLPATIAEAQIQNEAKVIPTGRTVQKALGAETYSIPISTIEAVETSDGTAVKTGRQLCISGPSEPEKIDVLPQPVEGIRLPPARDGSEARLVTDTEKSAPAGTGSNELLAEDTLSNRVSESSREKISERAGPDNGALPTIEEKRSSGPSAVELERMWLGRLNCLGATSSEATGSPDRALQVNVADGPVRSASPSLEGATDGKAPVSAFLLPATLSPTPDADQQTFSETELLPLVWSRAFGPNWIASPAMAALPASAGPQLAASIVAMRRQGNEAGINVALAPEELGGVRLRLEIDASDPERMVVHLAFDRPDTMDLFRRNADQLSDAIRAAGYSEAKLDFGQSGTGGAAPGDPNPSEDQARARPEAPAPSENANPLLVDHVIPTRPGQTTGLDLRI